MGCQTERIAARRRPAPSRAGAFALCLTALSLLGADAPPPAAGFDLDDVAAIASERSRRPYEPPPPLPAWLPALDYDLWRDIRFRPDHALWRAKGLPFSVQFFHPGFYYDRTVAIHEVDAEGVHPVRWEAAQFDYGRSRLPDPPPQELGYAGFRLHHPIKTPAYHDEVIVFVGASYFRAVGRDEGFGLSARGLAIDTALPSGEEFPWFREFWLVRPARNAKQMVVYALLDGPSLTGAYRFVIAPGEPTRVEVAARVFRRREVTKLGFAPLTSMFFHGEVRRPLIDDYRPEVHDSDGLLIHSSSGEWIFRPLDNPPSLTVSSFRLLDPVGFGLVQRDRDFDHYQDLEARSDLRPSAWITPRGAWRAGRVELVEIPSNEEVNDNIVAYWVPDAAPPLGEPMALDYEIAWYGQDATRPPAGRAVATRRDHGTSDDTLRFVLDFEGGELGKLAGEAGVRGIVSAFAADGSPVEIREQHILKNPVTGGWRLVFEVPTPDGDGTELRAFLMRGEDALTETWAYLLKE